MCWRFGVGATPDAVVIAGDLYDRAVPPKAQAVALLDDVLTELAAMRVPVVAISGNHDSTERVEFGARLMATGGVHLYGMARPDTAPLVLRDAAVGVYLPVRVADPATVRIEFGAESVRDYATLFAAQHARLQAQVPAGSRSVTYWRMRLSPAAKGPHPNGRFRSAVHRRCRGRLLRSMITRCSVTCIARNRSGSRISATAVRC